MAMLERYKRPGGFVQLVSLIETCAPSKQEKLLETVAVEDRLWADTVRSKMLSLARIYSWSDETLMEIFGTLQDLTVAVAIHAADEAMKARIHRFITQSRRRKIEDVHGSKTPTPAEVASTHVKIIETVRKMAVDGFLRFEKCDTEMMIEEEIEEKLAKAAAAAVSAPEPAGFAGLETFDPTSSVLHSYSPMTAPATATTAKVEPIADARELQLLKKKVADLEKLNAVLRHELTQAKAKLEQIKKIA